MQLLYDNAFVWPSRWYQLITCLMPGIDDVLTEYMGGYMHLFFVIILGRLHMYNCIHLLQTMTPFATVFANNIV